MALPRRRRAPFGAVLGAVGTVAITAALVPWRGDQALAVPALLDVLLVMAIAAYAGRRAAVLTAVVAAVALNVAFARPYGTLRVALVADGVALVVLVVVGVAVGTLVASLYERTEEAERRRDEVEFAAERLQGLAAEREVLAVEAARVEALEAVDGQRRALLRSVSHDLRTPLATIAGVATDLRTGTDYEPAVRDELLELVCDEADRLDRLVANLLSMSRIEAGALTPDRQVIDLGELVDERVRRLRGLFRAVRVQLDRPPAALLVDGDHSQLQQVVTNLLENAARHAPQGSTVWVTVRPDGPTGVLTVADEGAGVPDPERRHIFEPFRTGAGSHSSGIGLAICHAVVTAHGGTIAVDDDQGGGARFTVRLPVHDRTRDRR